MRVKKSLFMPSLLTIINDKELFRFRSDRIVCVASDGNYSTIRMADGDKRMVTCQLGQLERLMGDQLGPDGEKFIRIGRMLIVNKDYIYYVNPSKKQLVLSDSRNVKMELSASVEALRLLKDYLESELNSTQHGRD